MKAKSFMAAIIISQLLVAQQHDDTFPDSNAIWIQFRAEPIGIPPNTTYEYCSYKLFSHDTTMVNGNIYHNLYFDNYSDPILNFEFLWEPIDWFIHIGIFRTDSLKVYYQPINANVPSPCFIGESFDDLNPLGEFLLYDFGLSIGDTFDVQVDKQIVLQTIDSIDINGSYYKRFNFDLVNWYSGGNYWWIEGIGSHLGFFPYFNGFENYLGFECFHEDPDNTWLYPSFSYSQSPNGCDFLGVEEVVPPNDKFLIRIIDLMGRESDDKPNTLLIYVYSDGTTEKVFRVE